MVLSLASFQYLGTGPDTGMMVYLLLCIPKLANGLTIVDSVFISFAAVAIWSTVPLTIRLLTTLKRRSGLYFWSVLITSWGLCVRQVGILSSYLARQCPWVLRLVLAQVGWVMMVTGFSLVLYSRLSIIVQSRRTRMFVLAMIVFNGVIWHAAMTTIATGKAWERYAGDKSKLPAWQQVDYYFERTQICVFSAQETIISMLYLHAAYEYLKSGFAQKDKSRQIMTTLSLVQIIIIVIDIGIIVIDFLGYLQLKLFINSFVYAAKLELEFVALNQLVELSHIGTSDRGSKQFMACQEQPASDFFKAKVAESGSTSKLIRPVSVLSSDLESQRSRESALSYRSLDFLTMPADIR
jgi:hypothetical protein